MGGCVHSLFLFLHYRTVGLRLSLLMRPGLLKVVSQIRNHRILSKDLRGRSQMGQLR